MNVGAPLTDQRTDSAFHRDAKGIDHDNLGAEHPRRRRHLHADKAGAGDDEPGAGSRDDLTQGDGVVESPQAHYLGSPGDPGQRPRARSCRDYKPVEVQMPTVAQSDAAGCHVQALRPRAELELDPETLYFPGAPQGATLEIPGTAEQLLGQGRSVIGQVRFAAEQR